MIARRHPAAALSVGLLWLTLGLSAGAIRAQDVAQGIQPTKLHAALTLKGGVYPAKSGPPVYLVKLRSPGAANYAGSVPGFAATKPAPDQRFDARSPGAERYVNHLEATHERLLRQIGASGEKIYSYRYAMNGFAARLTREQVAELAQNQRVERIWPDSDQHLAADDSATFLGLEDRSGGLRADLKLKGENVVIGIIDSGIAPGHPALRDTEEHIPGFCKSSWAASSWLGKWLCGAIERDPPTTLVYGPVQGFHGACQTGEGFPRSACNNKVVGARYYIDGFLTTHELDPNAFLSPADADGHGTHVATTAAGNPTTATLFGTRIGPFSGIAPRARIAVYKACWLTPGAVLATCATSDLARAIDDAVADGVDIINYSVGSLETDLTAPDDMALLNAFDAGVLTVVAAGNDGPSPGTIGSPSSDPWVLTAAASSLNGTHFQEVVKITAPKDLVGQIAMKEASFTPALSADDALEGELVLVDDGIARSADGSAGDIHDGCEKPLNGDKLAGHITLIARGGCEFQTKLQFAAAAGAIAAIVYNDAGDPIIMNGDRGSVKIPAVMISSADARRIRDSLADGESVKISLQRGQFIEQRETGYEMGEFSSRGPNASDASFVKPDVTAPGINILAGDTPNAANGVRGEWYRYMSGTSMAAPETTGVAALIKEAHPDWSPAMLKSALMTTGYRQIYLADAETRANPFDMGAGHIQPNKAIHPGLVYDSGFLDHAAYLCGLEYSPFLPTDCAVLAAAGYSSSPSELNLPSIGDAKLISGDVITRRVTNVGTPSTYNVAVDTPPGIAVSVDPPTLALATGETGQYQVTFNSTGAALDQWTFGEISWSDGQHEVASPIAVKPVTLRVAKQMTLNGQSGNKTIPIAFGYSGAYALGVHGLREAYTENGFVAQDPDRKFTFRFDNGVTGHFLTVPPNQLFARFALFDDATDGADDLDMYLFYCPDDQCVQVAESGSLSSRERIDLENPKPGTYAVMVHGFQTDPANGPGANYTLYAWSVGINNNVGNLSVTAPISVTDGERTALGLAWSGLDPGKRFLGVLSHTTPAGLYAMTVVSIRTR